MSNHTHPRSPDVATPPPSSLCPTCGHVNTADWQYRRGQITETFYADDNGHEWLTRWNEVA